MKLQKISKELILILLLLFVLIISSIISAEELPLDEAIEMGLENNSVIREARNSVQNAERYLAKIMAQQDWQVNLNTKR